MFPFDDIMMAADAVALAPYVFVANTFLIEHKDLVFLHAKPWIPGGGISIFTVVIH